MQTLDIREDDFFAGPSLHERHLQRWAPTLLLGPTRLTSLSIVTDRVPWMPVLGLLSIRHLELTMNTMRPWTDVVMADLSFCSCLETLKTTALLEGIGLVDPSKWLPDLFLGNGVIIMW